MHRQPRFLAQLRQGGHRPDAQLGHDRLAMDLDGAFVDPEVAGDLLVEPAAQDVVEDLALARADRGEAGTKLVAMRPLLALLLVACKRATHSIEELLLWRR